MAKSRHAAASSVRVRVQKAATELGATLTSSTPSPTSNGIISGSAAASPHTATCMPRARAARTTRIDEAYHSRLERRGQFGDRRVGPVGGERVLDEVVGPDAEEVADIGEAVGDHRGRRHLDHHPELDVAGTAPRAFRRRPVSRRAADLDDLVDLDTIGSIIRTSPPVAASSMAVTGRRAGRSIETEANAAEAERRVRLDAALLPGRRLVASDVERPEYNRLIREGAPGSGHRSRAVRRPTAAPGRPRNNSSVRTRPIPAAPARSSRRPPRGPIRRSR